MKKNLTNNNFYLKKNLRIMKLTTILILICIIPVSASTYAQGHKVSVHVTNGTFYDVVTQIEKQSEFMFFYKSEEIDNSQRVTIAATDKLVPDILDEVLNTCGLKYEIKDRHIIISKSPPSAPAIVQQQNRRVSGTVYDERGETIIGANIIEKGTTNGVITDIDGKFSLTVQNNAILQISYIGFLTKEISIGNQSEFTITILENLAQLEEIVVVGYGTMRRRDVTGSVASISSERIREIPITRVDQALTGQLAGVQAIAATGEPGAEMIIRVRGVGSISASGSPLYVVDGFPLNNISTLNPEDVESIDVLKDASATAIYGSRGANGVVLITTKRGQEGQSRISVDIYTGWQSVLKIPKFFDAKQQAQYYYEGVRNNNMDRGVDVSLPHTQWTNKVPQTILDVLEGRNTYESDALNEVLRNAQQTRYSVSATGGTRDNKYSISGEYLDQDGIVIGSDFQRYAFTANLDVQLKRNLSLKVSMRNAMTNTRYQDNSNPGGGPNWGVIAEATSHQPYYPIYNEDGSYFVAFNLDASTNMYNAIAIARERNMRRHSRETVGNINLNYVIIPELNVNYMAGINLRNNKSTEFTPRLPVFNNIPATGSDATTFSMGWLSEITVNYDKVVNGHSFKALLGYTTQKDENKSASFESNSYPNNLVQTLNAVGGNIRTGTSTIGEWSLISYLGRLNYNYLNKYYVTASFRADGSSRFGSNNKYGYFPSAALAWRMSEEGFIKDIEFLNQLRFKLSYGETGNNFIGNYDHLATISYVRSILGNTLAQGYAPASLHNPDLTWEKQKQWNAGFEMSVYKNRISLSVDYFFSKNTDLLLDVNVPTISGFSTSLQNIGEVQNKGWEVVLNTVNLQGTFNWSTDFNISTFKNKVTKLGPEGDPIVSGTHITQIGQPIGMLYGFITDGIFMNQAEVDRGPVYGKGTADQSRPGDIRFKDVSGPDGVPDGIITTDDYTIIGNPYPDFYYGMSNRFSYKNISLNINVQGSHGNDVYNRANEIRLLTRSRSRTLSTQANWWKSEADPGDGKTPRPNDVPIGGARMNSQRFIESGSYFKINSISLSYRFTRSIAQKMSLNSLRIYATATNPLIITNYTSFNPEVSNSRNSLTPGIDYNNYPTAKSFIFGLSVDF